MFPRIVLASSGLFLAFLHLAGAAEPPAAPARSGITLEQTAGRGERIAFATPIPSYSFADDGALVERESGRNGKVRRLDPSTFEERPAPERPAGDPAPADDDEARIAALAKVVGEDEARAVFTTRGVGTFRFDAARAYLAEGRLYWTRDGEALAIAREGAKVELASSTADSRAVAYVRGNDLHVLDMASGAVRRLTEDGSATRLNGKLDWVYQEEVYGRGRFQGHFFSPDGATLAFLVLDESPVGDFALVDPIVEGHFRGELEVMKYPKAGDPNPVASLALADVATGTVRRVDLSSYAASEPILARVAFTPDSKRCLLVVQDRLQTRADLLAIDRETLAQECWIEERSDSWVDRPEAPRWLADGGFLWTSDRTGYRHVYRYGRDGARIGAVTAGEWSVDSISKIDDARAELWFTAKKDGAISRNLYRCGLDGSKLTRLTQGDGWHQTEIAPDGMLFLDRFSTLTDPPVVRLVAANGEVVKELARSERAQDVEVQTWKRVPVVARDGFALDVAVLEPVGPAADGGCPLWISNYGGPDMPTLEDRWSPNAWHQFLAQNGVMVLQLNVRTAAGIGRKISERCYRQLGRQELSDVEDAVDRLVAEGRVDPKRVGITGYSYGGFLAAHALTHSDRFALGIAGGGVYDWRMYDTIFTERYMRTPADNADGYAASSVIAAAANLRGHLLIHHGVDDDNVHLQNAFQLAWALQKADKSFEFMPYPESAHGLGDRDQTWHFRQLEWRTIREHLLRNRRVRT